MVLTRTGLRSMSKKELPTLRDEQKTTTADCPNELKRHSFFRDFGLVYATRQVEGDSTNPIAREPKGMGDHKDFFRGIFKDYMTVGDIQKRANALSACNPEFREHWEDLVQRKYNNERKAAATIQRSVRSVFENKIRQAKKEKLQSETAEIVPLAKSKAVRRKRFASGAVQSSV